MQQIFNDREQMLILPIPLSSRRPRDLSARSKQLDILVNMGDFVYPFEFKVASEYMW